MTSILLGLLAIGIGLMLCLRGALVLRTMIALWAALAGFAIGAGTVAAATGDTFLGGALALVVALSLAVVFGLVAYAFYAVAIMIAMAGFGFTLGTDLMIALGVTWSWLIVLVGVTLGVALGAAAIVLDLPVVVLVVLSAFAGSSLTLTGVLFLAGVVEADDLVEASTTQVLADTWWWWLCYVALGAIGVAVQLRVLATWRAAIRHQWDAPVTPRHTHHQ